jgi:hypothetical protein
MFVTTKRSKPLLKHASLLVLLLGVLLLAAAVYTSLSAPIVPGDHRAPAHEHPASAAPADSARAPTAPRIAATPPMAAATLAPASVR